MHICDDGQLDGTLSNRSGSRHDRSLFDEQAKQGVHPCPGLVERRKDQNREVTIDNRHRAFAVSLNLNSEEYEDGQLTFPEYGSAMYTPETGAAVVFSCSLLNERPEEHPTELQ